jgi:beta-lactamase class A
MKKISFTILLSILGIILNAQKVTAISNQSNDITLQRVQSEISRLSLISGGIVGVSAVHVESGIMINQNETVHFPLASSYKVPIAVELLTKIDSGTYSLDQMITIEKSDLHPGSGMIAERFNWPNSTKPGLALSVRSLMELMLLISDNSATDICLLLAGGPSAVNACMKRLGIEGLRVDRPTAFLIADFLGVDMDKNAPWSPALFDTLAKKVKPEDELMSSKKFDSTLLDVSTPAAMTNLLLKLFKVPVLKKESQSLLLDIMKRCETGLTRLKGALPPGTEVMHKTGTIGMTTNDVGIITLPGDAGHVVVSVFVKSSTKEIPERERAIAEVTRAIYDYFLFNH